MTAILVAALLSMPMHTPGVATSTSTRAVCSTKWGADRRHVTTAMKRTVAERYGVPRAKWRDYEFDHLVSRELGGADDVDNLWPQPWPEARQKDRIENLLHRRVCAGVLRLSEAQAQVRRWWTVKP